MVAQVEPWNSSAYATFFNMQTSSALTDADIRTDRRDIEIKLPLNKDVYTHTMLMLMARHQKIAKPFDEDFWVTQ